MPAINANDLTFKTEVIDESAKPVLVDFWAVWCTPCKIQGPIVEEVAQAAGDKLKVVKVEVDDSPIISSQYNILSIPTLAVFKKGEMVWQGVGVHQKQAILDELKKHLG